MIKILVIHGPNLNLLGKREPEIYGKATIEGINKKLNAIAKKKKITLEIFQSNHEGEIVDKIGGARDKYSALLINPAAYTHTSVAIRDAISAVNIPAVEVHLSNIYAREDFRRNSLIASVVKGQISGFGIDSYLYGLDAAINLAKNNGHELC
ncbi:MAG: type II 3-dehydroquinate dehydratase [Candidatus Omnitrophica bacterium CG02_land_8_20_14_3_00__42_8]|nr:MAG: type II 3-dehydroquinate dehydratase [Candidatus Omnitrophica bacterium CG02_land_8_20_14_3_00__42_8]PIW68272.1 MAG: type II 3-dehydroquinate dehydratase [Candidatus Omnitrophica bacterium CG12_big_fil_rev_8_21_14_0_65_42_8]